MELHSTPPLFSNFNATTYFYVQSLDVTHSKNDGRQIVRILLGLCTNQNSTNCDSFRLDFSRSLSRYNVMSSHDFPRHLSPISCTLFLRLSLEIDWEAEVWLRGSRLTEGLKVWLIGSSLTERFKVDWEVQGWLKGSVLTWKARSWIRWLK